MSSGENNKINQPNNLPAVSGSSLRTLGNQVQVLDNVLKERNPEYWYKKGLNSKAQSKWPEAVYFFSKASLLAPYEPIYILNEAFSLLVTQSHKKAYDKFLVAFDRMISWSEFKSALSESEWNKVFSEPVVLDSYEELLVHRIITVVKGDYEQFIKSNDNPSFYWTMDKYYSILLAICFNAKDNYDKALELIYLSLTTTDGEWGYPYHLKAGILVKQKQNSKAIESYELSIKLNPYNYWSYYWLGRCKKILKEYDAALIALNEAIKLKGNFSDILLHIGECHYRLSQYSLAIQCFNSGLNSETERKEVYSLRGDAHMRENNFEEAIKDFDSYLQYSPDNPNVIFKHGLVKYCLEQYKEAIVDFSSCLKIDSQHKDALKYRTDSYKALGLVDEVNQDL